LSEEKYARITLSFYRYLSIPDPNAFRDELFATWHGMNVLGRIYVAHEGINAQLSVPEPQWDAFKRHLLAMPGMENLRLNVAVENSTESFLKLIVRVRTKIVADGIEDPTFDASQCGEHLNAARFNEMLDAPDAVVVDMRNHYESEVGHFEGAIRPDVDTFRDSLPIIEDMLADNKQKPVLLYCTGGIRCEKASAYLKHKGFEQVYQLEGGIIEYTRQARAQNLPIRFIGKNFVFDERLGERITEDIIARCHQCGAPCDDHTNCLNESCHLLFIQCLACKEKHSGCCSSECQTVYTLPIEERRTLRRGKVAERNVFKKGRFGFKPGNAYRLADSK